MNVDQLNILLIRWGEWSNLKTPSTGHSLGYSSESTEYRMIRTAPAPERTLPTGWVCCDCAHRHGRTKHPRCCDKCGSHHLYSSPYVCTGKERPKHRKRPEMTLPDNVEAERMERVIAQLNNWKQIHMLKLHYIEGKEVDEAVDYVDWGRTKCHSLLSEAKDTLLNVFNISVGMTD